MKHQILTPRNNWQKRCEDSGFFFHSLDGKYWSEEYAYEFQQSEIDVIQKDATEVHLMCLDVLEDIVRKGDYENFYLKPALIEEIERSFKDRENNYIYSRFDFSYQDPSARPKLLEYNADTPTTLLEGGIVQQHWARDMQLNSFNDIDAKLVARWRLWGKKNPEAYKVFFTTVPSSEDVQNGMYMMDVCMRAGIDAQHILAEDIGYDGEDFLSLSNEVITHCFKLYPWEWMQKDKFFQNIGSKIHFIEPAWKVLLNKPILPYLWQKFKGHPNLLPSYFSMKEFHRNHPEITKVVSKELYGREGNNISIMFDGEVVESVAGEYNLAKVYQEYHPLPCFNNRWPMLGVWIVGDSAAGIGIRDDATKITKNSSWFVPHYIKD